MQGKTGPEMREQPPIAMLDQINVPRLEALGWTIIQCEMTRERLDRYRTSVCNFAATAPKPVKQRFKTASGISPEELCSMSKG